MVSKKHNSIFSYSLSRPYPFRWFTWTVAIGGVIFAVLFSFVALAADGYNVDFEYTTDLNSTLEAKYWYEKAPFSWISKNRVSCQPALLTTGNTYFTTNLGLVYSLNRVWRQDPIGSKDRMIPAAAYMNTIVEDREILQIEIYFARRDETRLAENW